MFRWLALVSVLILATPAAAAAPVAGCPPADSAAAVGAVQSMYSALGAGDIATARSWLAPGFYSFNGGSRFDTDSMLGLVTNDRRAGTSYAWRVTEPQVNFACDVAWITYVNQGSVTQAGRSYPMTWLESAILRYVNGRWTILFMHSTPAAPRQGR